MENNNINWLAMSDSAIVVAIGKYIKEQRLHQNITQSKLSEDAGVNRSTINQIEKGKAITLLSLIQILRALNVLHILEAFNIEQQVSPIELAKLEQQKRKRASKNDKKKPLDTNW